MNIRNIPEEKRLLYLKVEELISRAGKGDCIAALAYHALMYDNLHDISLPQSMMIGINCVDTLNLMHEIMGHKYFTSCQM